MRPVYCPRISASLWICTASSRVGAMISARGALRGRVGRHLAAQQRGVHRDEECGGLAGAGLRLPGDVHAGERARQGLRLDRGAALESGVGDAARERVRQVQVGERNVREMVV